MYDSPAKKSYQYAKGGLKKPSTSSPFWILHHLALLSPLHVLQLCEDVKLLPTSEVKNRPFRLKSFSPSFYLINSFLAYRD